MQSDFAANVTTDDTVCWRL